MTNGIREAAATATCKRSSLRSREQAPTELECRGVRAGVLISPQAQAQARARAQDRVQAQAATVDNDAATKGKEKQRVQLDKPKPEPKRACDGVHQPPAGVDAVLGPSPGLAALTYVLVSAAAF